MQRKRTCCIMAAIAVVFVLTGSAWGAAGDLIWQKNLSFLPEYNTTQITSMAASATTFFVSGTARNTSDGTSLGFIRAFDAATGQPKWSKHLALGDKSNVIGSLIADGDLLLARGGAFSYTQSPPDPPVYTLHRSFVWCYDADTGELLWKAKKNFESNYPGGGLYPAGSVTTLEVNNRLFFQAYQSGTDGVVDPSKCIIRAYQVRDIP